MRKRSLTILASLTAVALVVRCGGDDTSQPVVDAGGDGFSNEASVDTSLPDTSVPDTSTADTTVSDSPQEANSGDAGLVCPDGGTAVVVSSVTPAFAWTGGVTTLSISGSGFASTPTIAIVPSGVDGGAATALVHIAFVSTSSLTAQVPKGVSAGIYDIIVTDPNACGGTLVGKLSVVANAPPRILSVTPATGTTQADVAVTVTGCHFANNATLSTVDSSAALLAQGVSAVSCAGPVDTRCDSTNLCTMTGTVQDKTSAMAVGPYVVRVANPTDKTFGEWGTYVITAPSGKLSGNWVAAAGLNTGRRSLGVLNARLDDANRFLYAIGGEDATGAALNSVEMIAIDRFGQTSKSWTTLRYGLNTARSGLSVVAQGMYLYAIGGTSTKSGTAGNTPTGTPLGSIERALVLNPAQAPTLADPAVGSGGSLGVGTYYYRVSALMGNADADNPGGETLASDELAGTLATPGHIGLSWSAVSGASSYRVYRTLGANGSSSTEVLLADKVNGTTYSDDGSVAIGPDASGLTTPLPIGSTGVWVNQVSLSIPRLDAAAVVAPESNAANSPLHVYVVGGWADCTGGSTYVASNCYEYAPINAKGDTLAAFTKDVTHTVSNARVRFGAAPLNASNGPTALVDGGVDNSSFVIVGGGMGISSTGNTLEHALVQSGGALGVWSVPGKGYALQRDGSQLSVVNGYAYQFLGGSVGSYTQSSDLSTNATVTPLAVTFGNWSNAGANLGTSVGRYGLGLESAYFYVVGGTTNDTDALSTVYQIIY